MIQPLSLQLRELRPKRALDSGKSAQRCHSDEMALPFWEAVRRSPLYQASQGVLSAPPRTSIAGNMPVTNVTNVSLAALARPSPPNDPEKGRLLGHVGCYGL